MGSPSHACGDDVAYGKPDPRLVGLALRKLGLTGPRTVMIVLSGGFSAEALREAGCFAVAAECRP
jgi:beta-phosphoglucomutase-like phosphatase (HAD superfamily)